jgi:serine/threonine-protein kinase
MRPDPPADLIELVERLKLASADNVRGVYPLVQKLAGDLPLFSTLWVDALVVAKRLTPFQGMEINAGRGEHLQMGSYILVAPLLDVGYADYYRARHIESDRDVHLLIATCQQTESADAASQISSVAARLKSLHNRCVASPREAGTNGDQVWILLPADNATPLRELLLNVGRLTGGVVVEIARQMAVVLSDLETAEIIHGDISVASVWLADDGCIQLRHAGVRGILRPTEGFHAADVPPNALDGIAPERLNSDSRPTVASDLFACGCLWWQLLAGRSPLAGGTSVGRKRAAAGAKIADVRRYAPETPALLVTAIEACLQREPSQRPPSFGALSEMLGMPTAPGRRELLAAVGQLNGARSKNIVLTAGQALRSKDSPAWMAAIAGCLAVIVGVAWPFWHSQSAIPSSRQTATETAQAAVSTATQPKHRDVRRTKAKSSETIHADVKPASYVEQSPGVEPLVLPSGRTEWSDIKSSLRSGQIVRGKAGERPLIAVPTSGIVLAVDDVQFDGIDFIWRPAPDAAIDPERLAVIELRAAKATFRDCTWSAAADRRSGRPIAIRWTGPRRHGPLMPAGRLQIAGCSISGVAAAIDCRWDSPLSVNLSETLYLGPGPLLRIDHIPRIDEPIELQLSRLTLRDAAALIGIHAERLPRDETGTISIVANGCAFSPTPGGALILFACADSPARLARSIQWSGEGSVSSADSISALWLAGGAKSARREIDVAVEGIVASQLQFAGHADAGSSASRLTRWQGATQSDEPPGIPDGLPSPTASANESLLQTP